MHRILVASDSHGNCNYIKKTIETIRDINLIIHLGDYNSDAISLEREFKNYDFEYVKGNSDGNEFCFEEKVIDIEGFKFFISHGHKYGVKMGLDRLIYKAEELNANCVLYGHTHKEICIYEKNLLIMNPGAYCFDESSLGIIEIDNRKIKGCLIKVKS